MLKIKDAAKDLIANLGIGIFILVFVIIGAARLSSCVIPKAKDKDYSLPEGVKTIEFDRDNYRHSKISLHLTTLYSISVSNKKQKPHVYFLTDLSSLNAASFGNGIFLFWKSVADLPDGAIDAIIAHEIAHDLLLHSRKIQDLDDVRSFFTEVLSLFGGADRETEKTLQKWSSNITLPKYSQKQEFEADTYAVKILTKKGYKQANHSYAKTLKFIKDKYGEAGGGIFDSHPSIDARIRNVDKIVLD